MPRGAAMKVVMKAKGKGKKGRGRGKAKAAAPPAEGAAGAVGEGAIVLAKPEARLGGLRKKVLAELGEKTIEEATAEEKAKLLVADAKIEEANAMAEAQSAQAEEAQKEFNEAQEQAKAAIQEEVGAADKFREIKEKRTEMLEKVQNDRKDMLEEQKKLAMLEVMAVNNSKMKELEEKRKHAADLAENARKTLMEQRQREKEALEATRQALADARAQQKGFKRQAAELTSSLNKKPNASGDLDTVPATLPNTQKGDDID